MGATANAFRNRFQIVRRSWDLENVETKIFVSGFDMRKYGQCETHFQGVGVSGPPLAKKILQRAGITAASWSLKAIQKNNWTWLKHYGEGYVYKTSSSGLIEIRSMMK